MYLPCILERKKSYLSTFYPVIKQGIMPYFIVYLARSVMLGFVCDVISYICLEILITISGAKNYLCPSAFVEPRHLH